MEGIKDHLGNMQIADSVKMRASTCCTYTNLYGLCMLDSFQGISKLNGGRKDDSSFTLCFK